VWIDESVGEKSDAIAAEVAADNALLCGDVLTLHEFDGERPGSIGDAAGHASIKPLGRAGFAVQAVEPGQNVLRVHGAASRYGGHIHVQEFRGRHTDARGWAPAPSHEPRCRNR
jgi:hypothetical protein